MRSRIASASSGLIASLMYRKSMQETSCSGLISTSSFHKGLRSTFAWRSQTAFTRADDAFERAPNHNRGESVDRGDADLRAAAEREGKPMAFEVIAGVGP